MRALILIGVRKPNVAENIPGGPENLYTGLNGVELQSVAKEAAESGEFSFIGKLVNPACTPLAVQGGVAAEPVHSTPVFPKREPHAPKSPDKNPLEKIVDVAAQRAARLASGDASPKTGNTPPPPPAKKTGDDETQTN